MNSYLFILPWSLTSLGGVNQVVENLHDQMKLDGKYNPLVLVNSWSDTEVRQENINGIDHYFFRLRNPWNHSKKILNFLKYIAEVSFTIWHLYKFIKYNRISVINIHYCNLFALNISLMKYLGLFKGSYILSFHGKDLLSAKQSRRIEKFLWKLLLNSADKITTCSESLKVEFATFYEKATHNIVAIHNGIDTSLLIDNKARYLESCLKNKNFILNVATLEYKKGQDVLLKAFKEVSRNFTDLYLIIIGRPGGAEDQIKQLIDSLELSSRVFLYEGLTHDQVLAVMGRATIFVLPSRYEPFGIVTLESGVFGVPVIASNVGGIGEIITHNITGRLCESGDVNSFAKEIRYLLNSPEERKRLGENLKIHVKQNFSWKNTYIKYIDCI